MNLFKRPIGVLVCSMMGLLFGGSGCAGTESRCETVNDWSVHCGEGSISVDECAGAYDNSSDPCQDAFDNFADCLDTDDSCSSEDSECVGEAADFVNECGDE